MALFRSSEDRKARTAGVDESRIPPGQYYTDKWPVLQAGSVPRVDLATWDFRVFGLVEKPIRLSFDDLVALGAREQISDIHCVTRWTKLDMPWKGVPMTAVARPRPAAGQRPLRDRPRGAGLHGQPADRGDPGRGRDAGLRGGGPAADARARLPAAAARAQPLLLEERQVAARHRVGRTTDKPGFWEGYGYHNDADPWREERYGF